MVKHSRYPAGLFHLRQRHPGRHGQPARPADLATRPPARSPSPARRARSAVAARPRPDCRHRPGRAQTDARVVDEAGQGRRRPDRQPDRTWPRGAAVSGVVHRLGHQRGAAIRRLPRSTSRSGAPVVRPTPRTGIEVNLGQQQHGSTRTRGCTSKDNRPASRPPTGPVVATRSSTLNGSTWTTVASQVSRLRPPAGQLQRGAVHPRSHANAGTGAWSTNASGAKSGLTEVKRVCNRGGTSHRHRSSTNLALSVTPTGPVHLAVGERGRAQRRHRPAVLVERHGQPAVGHLAQHRRAVGPAGPGRPRSPLGSARRLLLRRRRQASALPASWKLQYMKLANGRPIYDGYILNRHPALTRSPPVWRGARGKRSEAGDPQPRRAADPHHRPDRHPDDLCAAPRR